MNFTLDIESPAKYFLFRRAKSCDDVAIGAAAAQRLTPLRSRSSYGYFDHDNPFSKKRNALRFVPRRVHADRKSDVQEHADAVQKPEPLKFVRSADERELAGMDRPRVSGAALPNKRQRCKTVELVKPMHGRTLSWW